jgi:hypothetical protein
MNGEHKKVNTAIETQHDRPLTERRLQMEIQSPWHKGTLLEEPTFTLCAKMTLDGKGDFCQQEIFN